MAPGHHRATGQPPFGRRCRLAPLCMRSAARGCPPKYGACGLSRACAHRIRECRPVLWSLPTDRATTACASDSKKFAAWDQNLMTEWHVRYGRRGVIYWHVERKSACIYSQLKTCSSSEVAAMIEGVLRHCTEMEIEKNYVDNHARVKWALPFASCSAFICCRDQSPPRAEALPA